jgi:predicted GIY-YIG superfamily endonuclease
MTDPISIGQASLNTRPHALYRFYDASDVLLYVGITVDPGARFKKHGGDKPWWSEVDRISIDHFATRQEALAAERKAIKEEQPLHNVIHNEFVDAAVTVDQPHRLAKDILELVAEHELEFAQQAIERVEDDIELPRDRDIAAARNAVFALVWDRTRSSSMMSRFADHLAILADAGEAYDHAYAELEESGGRYTKLDLHFQAAEKMIETISGFYLDDLPDVERAAWIARAGEGATQVSRAARHAIKFHLYGSVQVGYCLSVENHGALCADKAAYSVKFGNCINCEESCEGHVGLCQRHLDHAISQGLPIPEDRDGEPLTIADFESISKGR